ncbi:hypothetical protein M569_08970, partial [Genlisea aurea]
NSIVRSSLEEMLESLQRREENEKEEKPPALPARPKSNSRTRPPSTTRRLLTTGFEISETEIPQRQENGHQKSSSGAKRVQEIDPVESPSVLEKTELANGSRRRFRDSERDGGPVNHFSNKVGNVDYLFWYKLCIWCRPKDLFWQKGQIQSTTGEKALVLLSDARVVAVSTRDIVPANPDILDDVDNLVQLSYLNEPSVVHSIQCRYSRDIIYTKAGPVLIALNPFKRVELYGNDFVTAYREKLLSSPHAYAAVNAAYSEIMAGGRNQSIIISGESASGKTGTANRVLEYLAGICEDGGIGFKLLQSRYILEAFGNAKTDRNDNSSRFGNLVEIQFSSQGRICSANISTCKLTVEIFIINQSRFGHLAQGDRSFHIFYQLCSGAPSDLREHWRIKSAPEYKYLYQNNALENRCADDPQKFHMLMGALTAVGICKEDQEHLFQLLSAVLWLGNISFLETDDQAHIEVADTEAVNIVSRLMGCGKYDLIRALSTCDVKLGKDIVSKRLTLEQAIDRRDALAKIIYTNLFEWLVERINLSLSMDKQDTWKSISIVDIPGFNITENNGFERFCINYANERLLQHFHRHTLKLEQEEYELDGVHWTKIDFKDNKDCLDLFERKPAGIFAILDDATYQPNASKSTFTAKLSQDLSTRRCFKGEKRDDGAFTVRHSSGEVLYDASDFLKENKGPLYPEAVHLLSSSAQKHPRCFSSMLLKQLDCIGITSQQSEIPPFRNRSSVSKLEDELSKIFQHLGSTKPRFIYCIRPNNKRVPAFFEPNLVLQQLRSCNVLEVLRVSKCGYPAKVAHHEFIRRYELLAPENVAERDPLGLSIAILQHVGVQPEMYQVGYTKLYFRAGQIDIVENARQRALQQGAFELQRRYGSRHARLTFHELNEVVTKLQSYIRGEISRKKFRKRPHLVGRDDHQATAAALYIQSAIRGWLARRHLTRRRDSELHAKVSQKKNVVVVPHASIIEELRNRAETAEAAVSHKEKENRALREQVQQLERRWPRYETKMKSMEDMWQKQMQSLQASL